MKILMAGDVHGDLGHMKYLLKIAQDEGCDRIFVLGDFGYWPHTGDGVAFLKFLEKVAAQAGVVVYWLRGNHDKVIDIPRHCLAQDDEDFTLISPHVRYAPDGHSWTWDNLTFLAFGGAYSVDKEWRLEQEQRKRAAMARENGYRIDGGHAPRPELEETAGTLWFPEEEASDQDVMRVIDAVSDVDVLLTHDKPRWSNPEWNRKDLPLCIANQNRIQALVNYLRPYLLLHGHLHYFYRDVLNAHLPSGHPDRTIVIGLDCGQEKRSESWLVMDTDDIHTRYTAKTFSTTLHTTADSAINEESAAGGESTPTPQLPS